MNDYDYRKLAFTAAGFIEDMLAFGYIPRHHRHQAQEAVGAMYALLPSLLNEMHAQALRDDALRSLEAA